MQTRHASLHCTCLRQLNSRFRPERQFLQSNRLANRASRGFKAVVAAGFSPPTVAETKAKFTDYFSQPISAIYGATVQELIVQQHFIRYNKNYNYNAIFALGVTSAFDQILEGATGSEEIFTAYIKSLDEDPQRYRKDSQALEEACSGLNGLSGLIPVEGESMNAVQSAVKSVAEKVAKNEMHYSKFFAIGLFRILELTGVKEPQALGSLVSAIGVKQDAVNRDLKLYKNILTKVSAGKELMREVIEREKKKAAERAAARAAQEVPAAEKAEAVAE